MKIKWIALALAVTILFASCGAPVNNSSSSEEAVSSSAESLPASAYFGTLTGLPIDAELIGRRPMSVIINNLRAAIPQHGIGSADMWWECLAEGGITRIMAIYQDYTKLPMTGPVRSVREYYLDFAAPFDTLFVHFGGSYPAYDIIAEKQLQTLDGKVYSDIAFWLDSKLASQRGGKEHANFTDAQHIQKAIDGSGTSIYSTGKKPLSPVFSFAAPDETVPAGSITAKKVTVSYSSYTVATFDYDGDSGKYLKGQFGGKHVDAITGEQLNPDNVLVLFIGTSLHPAGSGLLKLDFTSGGDGYYISRGAAEKITWTKSSYGSAFALKTEGGQNLTMNAGRTYVCVVDQERAEKVVFS